MVAVAKFEVELESFFFELDHKYFVDKFNII